MAEVIWDNDDHYSDDSDVYNGSVASGSLQKCWSGWKEWDEKISPCGSASKKFHNEGSVASLLELAVRCVAAQIPFELVERVDPPVPEHLQLRIAYWSFPDNEEDIRLYSCLANGSSVEYIHGLQLYRCGLVKDPLQIGFLLSAKVQLHNPLSQITMKVAVTFDRRRVTSCKCTCSLSAYWCSHVVAVCLHRIKKPETVTLRTPLSDSLSLLNRDQLQKFAQCLISDQPPQRILPTAQRLVDDILSGQTSYINSMPGAPDPTAGASISDQASWCFDEEIMREDIKEIVTKFRKGTHVVLNDGCESTSSAPPVATEWSTFLGSFRDREPGGLWNLLSIVREMYKRQDRNAVTLLSILTNEFLGCEPIVVWWFNIWVRLHTGRGEEQLNVQDNKFSLKMVSSSLCEEIVVLWKLAALNPALSPEERKLLLKKFSEWHAMIIGKVMDSCKSGNTYGLDIFPGFNSAIRACQMDWDRYPLRPLQVNSCKAALNHHGDSHHCTHYNLQRVNTAHELFPSHCDRLKWPRDHDGNCNNTSSRGLSENIADGDDPFAPATEIDCREGVGSHCSSDVNVEPHSSVSNDSSRKIREEQRSEENDAEGLAPYVEITKGAKVEKTDLVLMAAQKQSAISNSVDEGIKSMKTSAEHEEKGDKQLKQQVLLARAEGLRAHGHGREATILAVRLANELLANPPNLMLEIPIMLTEGETRKMSPISHKKGYLMWAALSKCLFLCSVLTEVQEHAGLAFRVGFFGLEMARPPASTKWLEIKLMSLEHDLAILLKKIPLGPTELGIVRQKAQQLCNGSLCSRGKTLPLILAGVIFEVLEGSGRLGEMQLETDESMAFEAAVAALGLKARVSEDDHPFLCEGTRRQRGTLAVTLLVHYRETKSKLKRIEQKLFDLEIWSSVKTPLRAQAPPNPPPSKLNISATNSAGMPSEADAHFLFQLAKIVLAKAVGKMSAVPPPSTGASTQNICGPHTALLISAFQIGLFALRLHNCVFPEWLSRKHSSHVTWITSQAMDIGASAIVCLIMKWNGLLTPQEAVSIADLASKSRQPDMVCTAAKLALSCLLYSHALSLKEVMRAIMQCKEQSHAMWEQSLLNVEKALEENCVLPEVLFHVARNWYDLHLVYSSSVELETSFGKISQRLVDSHGAFFSVDQPSAHVHQIPEVQQGGLVKASPPDVPIYYVPSHNFSITNLRPIFRNLWLTPPPNQPALPHPCVLQPYPVSASQSMCQSEIRFQLLQPFQMGLMPHPSGQMLMPNTGTMSSSVQEITMPNIANWPPSMPNNSSSLPGAIPPVSVAAGHNPEQQSLNAPLLNSYRLGILALKALALKVYEPATWASLYVDDVKVLLRIAKKLGDSFVNQFCNIAVNSIVSPYLLFEIALEAAQFLASNGSRLSVLSHLQSGLHPLVSKSQQMFIHCLHQKLDHLNEGNYEEFVKVMLAARKVCLVTLDGTQKFKDCLSSIRSSQSCKEELWAQISAALQSAGQ